MSQQLAFYKQIVDNLCHHFKVPDPANLCSIVIAANIKIKHAKLELKELRHLEKRHAKDRQLVQNMQMLVRDCLTQPELSFKQSNHNIS
jgi:hypothetical protein